MSYLLICKHLSKHPVAIIRCLTEQSSSALKKQTCFQLKTLQARKYVTLGRNELRKLKSLRGSVISNCVNNVSKRRVFLKGEPPDPKATRTLPQRNEFKRLLSLAKPERWRLLGAVGLLLISSVTTMAVPFGMGKIIDIIYSGSTESGGQMLERLKTVCAILTGVFFLGAAANFGRIYLMTTSGQRIIRTLRNNLFTSIMRQEVAFFDRTKTGELINRLSTDTSLIGQSVTMNISDGLRSAAQATGGLSLMFYVSPKLATIVLGIVPPVAITAVIYGRFVRKISKKTQDSLASATTVAEERIGNIRTVRAFAKEDNEVKSYEAKTHEVLLLSYKEALARGIFFGSAGLSGNLVILAVLYYGGGMMNEAQLSVGELTSFLLYAAYIGVSIGGLSSFYTEMMRGLGASTRLWQLLDRQPTIPTNTGLHLPRPLEGNITFKDVTFNYPTREDMPIFSNLTLDVPAGKVLAVVGPSGSGKSTLAALILRYYDPNQGAVFIDGMDITKLNPHWLRNHIGTVSQEPILFSCSVADNIMYGAADPSQVTPSDIVNAAKQANAHNFIESFPDKYNTIVGERGLMLSGGQRQRVAIARAILKNPGILLLDEATSALDAESEFLVQEALDRLMVGRTVVTIAHRLSTIKNADRIAVIDNGHVVETGSYSDLMQLDEGLFRKLVERQTIVNS